MCNCNKDQRKKPSISNIIQGFSNLGKDIIQNKEVKDNLVVKRSTICTTCIYIGQDYISVITPETLYLELKGKKCLVCGCILSAKLRVPQERCPRNYW